MFDNYYTNFTPKSQVISFNRRWTRIHADSTDDMFLACPELVEWDMRDTSDEIRIMAAEIADLDSLRRDTKENQILNTNE